VTRLPVTLVVITSLALGPGCKKDEPAAPAPTPAAPAKSAPSDAKTPPPTAQAPAKGEPSTPSTPVAVTQVAVPEPSYTAELDPLLELVPTDAKSFVVVRDPGEIVDGFGWLIAEQKSLWTRVLDATRDPAKPDADAGIRRVLTEYELVQSALAAGGVHLDRGMIVIEDAQDRDVTVVAADDAEAVPKLLRTLSLHPDEVKTTCKTLEVAGMVACSDDAAAVTAFAPGKDAKGMRSKLEAELDADDVAHGNVVAHVPAKDGTMAFAVMTAPGVVQVDFKPPGMAEFAAIDAAGPAQMLSLVPAGSSFSWFRFDGGAVVSRASGAPGMAMNMLKALSGEVLMASPGSKAGFATIVGITDKTPIAGLIPMAGLAADQIPPLPDGTKVKLVVEDVDDGAGGKVQALRATAEGSASLSKLREQVGFEPELTAFVTSQFAAIAVGTGPSIIGELAKSELAGPSPALLAELPPGLAKALTDQTTSMVVHAEFDGMFGPTVREQLAAAMATVPMPPDSKIAPADALDIALLAGSPLSSLSVWNTSSGSDVVFHVAVRAFGDPASEEGRAAQAARLDVVAGRKDAATAYGSLVSTYPSSSRIEAYRARAGQAGAGGAMTGGALAGVMAAIAIPAFATYMARAKKVEAPAIPTQAPPR